MKTYLPNSEAVRVGPLSVSSSFTRLMDSEDFQGCMALTSKKLGLEATGHINTHYLAQYKLYDNDITLDSVYFSASCAGYLRTTIADFPVCQVLAKIATDDMEQARFKELYIDPLSKADLIDHFTNCHWVNFGMDITSFSIDLETLSQVTDTYYWEERGNAIHQSVEIRHNLSTNEKTNYYRHALTGDETLKAPESFSAFEMASLSAVVDDAKAAAAKGRIHDVFVYARKVDARGRPYISFYLTSVIENGEDPKSGQ